MYKTAECVSPRHPDKLCDRISDAILDACLAEDPNARVAIETMGGHGIISVTGELTTSAHINVRAIVRNIVGDQYGLQINIVQQSPEIAQGVDTGGAGDQGIMVGYACRDNEAMIPQELYLARNLCQHLYEKYPQDGKSQITIDENGQIKTVVASFARAEKSALVELIRQWLELQGIKDNDDIIIHANPAGDWNICEFEADTGLTGRKLAVDNYGPQIPIGGGAFSGKDASKVDRSAAYMARKIAVDALKENPEAREAMVKLAYSIGVAEPVMVSVIMDGVEVPFVNSKYDLRPSGIIEFLELRKPKFAKTAEWGHMGNGFSWDE